MYINDFENYSPIEFEKLCGNLLLSLGYTIQYTKASGDGGIDIRATLNHALSQGLHIIQCKRYSGNVGEPVIRDLYGVVMSERADHGYLITSGGFTDSAIEFSKNKQITLIDGNELKKLLQKYNCQHSFATVESPKEKIKELLGDFYLNLQHDEIVEQFNTNSNSLIETVCIAYNAFDTATKFALDLNFIKFDKNKRKQLLLYILELLKPHVSIKFDVLDKEESYYLFIAKLIYAQTSLLLGNFDDSENTYKSILNWKDISKAYKTDNNLKNELLLTILFMCNLYVLTGKKELAYQWFNQQTTTQLVELSKKKIYNQYNYLKIRATTENNEAWMNSLDYWLKYAIYQLENFIDSKYFFILNAFDIDWLRNENKLLYNPIESKYQAEIRSDIDNEEYFIDSNQKWWYRYFADKNGYRDFSISNEVYWNNRNVNWFEEPWTYINFL